MPVSWSQRRTSKMPIVRWASWPSSAWRSAGPSSGRLPLSADTCRCGYAVTQLMNPCRVLWGGLPILAPVAFGGFVLLLWGFPMKEARVSPGLFLSGRLPCSAVGVPGCRGVLLLIFSATLSACLCRGLQSLTSFHCSGPSMLSWSSVPSALQPSWLAFQDSL